MPAAWIKVVEDDDADDVLRAQYKRRFNPKTGRAWSMDKAQSLNPELLRARMDIAEVTRFSGRGLSRLDRELISVVVSALNECAYCIHQHVRHVRNLSGDPALAEAVAKDYRTADLSPRQRVMLDYAARLTAEPGRVAQADVERLRAEGFTDYDILDINANAAWFNYINRVITGLGVEMEEE
ncbi:MAG: peroxidase-related enzyme [Chloroflexi bacterium]|nr:peroxidase-related enzyme [Chloroflexota bacterium]